MCEVLAVSESGYYRSLKPTPKKERQQRLLVKIKEIIEEHEDNSNYGVQRILLALSQRGYQDQLQHRLSNDEEARPAEESEASPKRHYTRGRHSSSVTKM